MVSNDTKYMNTYRSKNLKPMLQERVFHIYKKNTEETVVIKHCVSVDELEQMMADKKIDWENWEIVPVESEYCEHDIDGDGSF